MNKKLLEEITKICIETGGITVNCNNFEILNIPDVWLFPKYPDKTKIINYGADLSVEIDSFYSTNKVLLDNNDLYLGIWLNKKNMSWYIDISTAIVDKVVAVKVATEINENSTRKIESIYNPGRDEIIFLL